MRKAIPEHLRKIVAHRAGFRCEYCLSSEADSPLSFEVDHIVSQKHDGPTVLENLAYTCIICNRKKGSNVATVNYPVRQSILLYNPREDIWLEHFKIDDALIIGKTEIGQATIKVLDLNHIDRIIERRIQIASGSYPS